MPDGLFIIDKGAGLSSHDVVRQMRRLCGTRKVGHAGTLDPLATGVLPVAVNGGTRILQFLTETEKSYEAELLLGSATDTQDRLGQVVATGSWQGIGQEQLTTVLNRFSGPITQLPPMYSALKKDGVPLYKLARQGIEVERQERQVIIHSCTLLEFTPPRAAIAVRCSKGTYIRTLIDDIGRELGCYAHMSELRRTANCGCSIRHAVTLDTLAALSEEERWSFMISPYAALSYFPDLPLADSGVVRLSNGIPPGVEDLKVPIDLTPGCRVRLSSGKRLLAVAVFEPERLQEQRSDFRLLRVMGTIEL